jgi:hypothetical protein
VPSAGRAAVDTTLQAPSTARRDLARFDAPNSALSVAGDATASRCSGASSPFVPVEPVTTLPPCATVDDHAQTPHWTVAYLASSAPMPPVTNLRWTSPTGRLRVAISSGRRDLRGFDAVTMRVAPDPATTGPVDVSVRFVDAAGRNVTVPVSAVSNALQRLPGGDYGLPKTMLRSVRIPIARLKSLALRDVRRVELVTDRVPRGSVFVSDLAVVRASLGRSSVPKLPRLSVTSVAIDEGDTGTKLMRFHVRMSRKWSRTVRVFFDAAVGELFGVENVLPGSQFVAIKPGRTSASLTLTVRSDTLSGPNIVFPVVLSIPSEAIIDRSIGAGIVRDDDPDAVLQIDPASAVESDGRLRMPMRVSAPTSQGVFVEATVEDVTARLFEDYDTDFAFGEIAPRATTGFLELPLVDDDLEEPNETFRLRPVFVFGADYAGPAALTGTIVDDD